MNNYLRDRAMRRDMQMRDGRNPYGSRGGYVTSRRGRRGGRDREMADYNYGSERDRGYDMRYAGEPMGADGHYPMERYGEHTRPMQYEMYGVAGVQPMMDYDYARGGRASQGRSSRGRDYGMYDYNYDYANYDYAKEDEEEYKKELHKWTEKLKKHDRFGWNEDQVAQKAKEMGVKFDKFTEDEFFAVYLMHISDYKNASNDPHYYLVLTKQWLEDDDVKMQGSDKLCAYLYEIVLGGEEE